ncbi:hypothetical protein M1512_00980 [Patescibacteria group bacterium]|nr:hypothetical protein [Patescibacteria group bacterium]
MNIQKRLLNQNGFAPLIISIVIVVVLTLLVLGFVTLVNHSKNTALTQQLNNDAYYAAESGVNDAIQAIINGYDTSKTSCQPITSAPTPTVPGWQYLSNNLVNSSHDYYSCLLISTTPSTLQYGSVGPTQPTVAILSTVNSQGTPTDPATIEFSWEPSLQVAQYPYKFESTPPNPHCTSSIDGPCLPPISVWGSGVTGILRLALTPLPTGGPLPGNTSTTYTAFLYPYGPVNPTPPGQGLLDNSTIGANSGPVIGGNCNNNSPYPDKCTVIIDVTGSPVTTNGYLMSLRSLYTNSQVTISAFDSNGKHLYFQNAQTMIDSTGDVQGVLKRIQVRIPTINDSGYPGFDIASSYSICKDLVSYPTNRSTGEAGNTQSNCLLTVIPSGL